MMAILLSQSARATVKRIHSRPSGMTLVGTGSRQYVGRESVEPGALSGSGRALVRNRMGEVPTFSSRFTRRRPPQCGWKTVEGVRRWRECPGARFVKEGVIAVQNIGHRNRASLQSARSIEILLIPGFFSGFTGASSYP